MRHATTTKLILSGVAGCAALALLPSALTGVPGAGAASSPSEYDLTGIVRDFRESHADFGIMPAEGLGHSAGSVHVWLPGDNRPLFVGGGSKVDAQWKDSLNRNIAPHMAGSMPAVDRSWALGIRVTDRVEVKKGCQIDSFSSTRGLYNDNGNYGKQAYVSTDSTGNDKIDVEKNAVIYGDLHCGPGGDPNDVFKLEGWVTGSQNVLSQAEGTVQIVLPDAADIEANAGDLTIDNTTVSWVGWIPADEEDEDDTKALLYDDVRLDNGAVVNVSGDLRILCRTFEMDDGSIINMAPDSSLTFFVLETGEDVKIKDGSMINVAPSSAAGVDSSMFTLNYFGTKKIQVEKGSHAYMIAAAPNGELELKDDAHVYGSYLGKSLKLDKFSGFHVDASNGDDSVYNPAILVRDKIEFKDNVVVDHFDSTLGRYDCVGDGHGDGHGDGTNCGGDALIQTNAVKSDKVKIEDESDIGADIVVGVGADPDSVIKIDGDSTHSGNAFSMASPAAIPSVTPPIMTVPFSGDVEHKNTTVTLATDLYCKKLKLERATLEIAGTVTIRCDDKLEMKDQAEIKLLPGARLTIYVKKDLKVEDRCLINANTGDPKLVLIRRMSLGKKGKIEIKKDSEVHAWIQGAKTELKLEDRARLYGNFMGEKAKIKKSAELHVDMAYLITCVNVDDTSGSSGAAGDGGVSSSGSFNEWFRDIAGVNQSTVHSITMTDNGSGIYEYLDDDFRPIDGELFGNEGEPDNSHFTYSISADFTYSECGGQFVQFGGGDGVWMFVNGRLVMDLGGMESSEKQYVEMDRLGLTGGQDYTLHIFYANRRTNSREFKLRTNIVMSTARSIPIVSAAYD